MTTIKLFGTDGIRARAGEFPLNAQTIVAIGQALGEKLQGPLLIGQDTRVSSPWILELLKEGVHRTTATAQDAGVLPTPAIALLTRDSGHAGGVMISASHNPFDDNGIKVFAADGTKLKDADEIEIERRILELLPQGASEAVSAVPDVSVSGRNESFWPARYSQLLVSHFPEGQWMRGLTVMVDCANGAMSQIAPSILDGLGARVQVVSASPTGKNINNGCGAVHLKALCERMQSETADFGVAFDGDGDRSLFVSRACREIDGDAVLLMMARRLRPGAVVGTSMTNFALEKMLEAQGIPLKRVGVGDRFIFEEMQRGNGLQASLGGEPSGHIIFPDFGLSGDGLLTTLKVAETMVTSGKSMDELTSDWVAAPQMLKGVRVRRKVPLEDLPGLKAVMDEALKAIEGRGRLVVRYSGTEPLLRVMIESDDAGRNEIWMEKLLLAIKEDFKKLP